MAAATAGITTISKGQAQARSVPRIHGMVQTVLGQLDASELGFTLPHEHISDGPYYLNQWPKAWGGKAEFVAKAVDQLKAAKAAGITTIVDLTTYDV